jgi:hypothetical protein
LIGPELKEKNFIFFAKIFFMFLKLINHPKGILYCIL